MCAVSVSCVVGLSLVHLRLSAHRTCTGQGICDPVRPPMTFFYQGTSCERVIYHRTKRDKPVSVRDYLTRQARLYVVDSFSSEMRHSRIAMFPRNTRRAPVASRCDPLVLRCLQSLGLETYRDSFENVDFIEFIRMPRKTYEAFGDNFSNRYQELLMRIRALCASTYDLSEEYTWIPAGCSAQLAATTQPERYGHRGDYVDWNLTKGDECPDGVGRDPEAHRSSTSSANSSTAQPLIRCMEIPDHIDPGEECAQVYCSHLPGTCDKTQYGDARPWRP